MDKVALTELLGKVASGEVDTDFAVRQLQAAPFVELGYAKPDLHRAVRQGVCEVIYGAGKTAEQISGIVLALAGAGQDHVLITRIDAEKNRELTGLLAKEGLDAPEYHPEANLAIVGGMPDATGNGHVVVVSAGTSDLYASEEAALTAEAMGSRVTRIYDAGVAGIHRLLAHLDELLDATAVVAVAGMEGALASVVGGLVSCPVIAVPTSVGYGASFDGLAALLAMINSCSSGVSVVNIDNGFGAGYQASLIDHAPGPRNDNIGR